MNKKNVITLIIAALAIGVCIYFLYTMLAPKPAVKTTTKQEENKVTETVPAEINETLFQKINTLSDYGKPDLSRRLLR
jgi:Flp pilus assembly protein CpaB